MTERRRPVDFMDMAMPAGIILMFCSIGGLFAEHQMHVPFEFDLRPLVLIGVIMTALGAIAHHVRR